MALIIRFQYTIRHHRLVLCEIHLGQDIQLIKTFSPHINEIASSLYCLQISKNQYLIIMLITMYNIKIMTEIETDLYVSG